MQLSFLIAFQVKNRVNDHEAHCQKKKEMACIKTSLCAWHSINPFCFHRGFSKTNLSCLRRSVDAWTTWQQGSVIRMDRENQDSVWWIGGSRVSDRRLGADCSLVLALCPFIGCKPAEDDGCDSLLNMSVDDHFKLDWKTSLFRAMCENARNGSMW